MKRVYKYALLPMGDIVVVHLPFGAGVLTVHEQKGEVYLWALVDPLETATTARTFRIAGTGHDMSDAECDEYVGTFFLCGNQLVFHVFEVMS